MNIKPLLIAVTLAVIFGLENIFPHYRDRTARLRHAAPHVLTAILNGLLTRFALAGVTIAAIGWAQNHTAVLPGLARPPAGAELVFVFVLFDIWMYFWHMANHRIAFLWRFHRAHH